MQEDVKRFLDSISYEKEYEELNQIEIEKVYLNKAKRLFNVVMLSEDLLPYEVASSLLLAGQNKIHGKENCTITLKFNHMKEEILQDYLENILKIYKMKKPSLSGVLSTVPEIKENHVNFEVSNKAEEEDLKREFYYMEEDLERFGITDIDFSVSLNEELKKSIQEEIEKEKMETKVIEEKPKIEGNIIVGKEINGEKTAINNIMGEQKGVILEAYVFGIDTLERENINIITLKISDKTNSLLAKIFKKDKKEYQAVMSALKVGKWFRFQGNVEYDNFARDFVLGVRNMEKIDSQDEVVKDDAEIPRVELHMHTMMSAMDGVIDASKIVSYVSKMGQKAVAITDHNCVQAFPDLFHSIEAYNKGKEGKDRFKVLYGAEMNIVNDDVDFIFNPRTFSLLEDTYVVFDTETTGFYAGSDQMIEIGAVKIQNGKILDRFDELIDPHRPIPKKITELTFITDEMLHGKDNEENVTRRFLEWAGDLPMVAHNAKFDISFMKAACNKYGFKEFDATVLDTMSLARMLHPDWPNHKLQTLTKRLDVPWDEEKHHRADYDAEGTALCFYKMCKVLNDRNIETTDHLLEEVDMDALVRFSYPFHACVIAKDRVGLKNLFKIISIANTKYLYKNEQPKIPRRDISKLREGLLIGSGCINGEIFDKAGSKEDEELVNMMSFYDYIEVQPISAFEHLIGPERKFQSVYEAEEYIKRIVRVAKEAGKPVVATGDVHNLTKDDKIYREIIVNQKFNGKLHPLNRRGINVPNMYLKTTAEMLDDFKFLGEDLAYEIVVTNTNKIADMVEEIEVIIDTGGIPFAPKIENSQMIVTEMVYNKAKEWYGEPLPYHIEERIALELYGAPLIEAVKKNASSDEAEIYKRLHDVILKGPESVQEEISFAVLKDEPELSKEEALKKAKDKMTAIIGANFDVIYLIAQKLVKHSNDEGFLVGSRGSVGSSFVANLMGITEVNSLAPHYRCPKCQYSQFNDDNGEPLGNSCKDGFDLPDKKCPKCGTRMHKDGHDIPFQTFQWLGFTVPDAWGWTGIGRTLPYKDLTTND